jgi:6-phosphofructokinase 1
MKRLAILTSGGDAPGMNAAVRAILYSGMQHGYEVLGVRGGYRGLMAGAFTRLDHGAFDDAMRLAGTALGTSRCVEFRDSQGQDRAAEILRAHEIDALIVIGGNGSQTGAYALAQRGLTVIGVASTIDNDLVGSDVSIGTTTAQGVAVEAIDRLRATAVAHQRAFLLEVMGRHCGYLAVAAAIAGGADALVAPECEQENEPTPDALAARLWRLHECGQRHALIVVAEGARWHAQALLDHFTTRPTALPLELRMTRLGHVQRGAAPAVFDRMLAARLGNAAIEHLLAGESGVLIGLRAGSAQATPLAEVAGRWRAADPQLVALAQALLR